MSTRRTRHFLSSGMCALSVFVALASGCSRTDFASNKKSAQEAGKPNTQPPGEQNVGKGEETVKPGAEGLPGSGSNADTQANAGKEQANAGEEQANAGKEQLPPGGTFGKKDDGVTRGLVGNVYKLPEGTAWLPEFSKHTPVARLVVGKLDIPDRSFTEGFPGVKDLIEWFGIVFRGKLKIDASGMYEFMLTSDDGTKLFIDGDLVINNDGVHSVESEVGKKSLSEGSHSIKVEYFQGPRDSIALQLLWRRPTVDEWEIVPIDVLDRP